MTKFNFIAYYFYIMQAVCPHEFRRQSPNLTFIAQFRCNSLTMTIEYHRIEDIENYKLYSSSFTHEKLPEQMKSWYSSVFDLYRHLLVSQLNYQIIPENGWVKINHLMDSSGNMGSANFGSTLISLSKISVDQNIKLKKAIEMLAGKFVEQRSQFNQYKSKAILKQIQLIKLVQATNEKLTAFQLQMNKNISDLNEKIAELHSKVDDKVKVKQQNFNNQSVCSKNLLQTSQNRNHSQKSPINSNLIRAKSQNSHAHRETHQNSSKLSEMKVEERKQSVDKKQKKLEQHNKNFSLEKPKKIIAKRTKMVFIKQNIHRCFQIIDLSTIKSIQDDNKLAIIIPEPNQKHKYSIKFVIMRVSGWMGFGICDKQVVANNNFKFMHASRQKHGTFLMTNEGIVWSYYQGYNKLETDFPSFKRCQTITVSVDIKQQIVRFTRELQHYEMPFTHLKENNMAFCAYVFKKGDCIRIYPA